MNILVIVDSPPFRKCGGGPKAAALIPHREK
jgi:hypothetical protein